ncbi:MAG: hypothetical protein KJ666_03295 [Bacteroidetes bacterium]|nr:hypothetical protein [Bacteroidota bacterium]MBU2585066.1 hypothetical protein [Bacteroidota bacterium]
MFRVFIIILVTTTFIPCGYSQVESNKVIDEIIKKGVEQILLQNYSNADSIFSGIEHVDPKNPMMELMKASVMISMATDYEEPFNENKFEELLKNAENKIKLYFSSKLKKDYYFGLLNGFHSYADWYRGKWFGAFANGLRALNYFEELLEHSRNAYDAKIAIGIYKYWRSRKSEVLSWLPFLNDEKSYGISLIEEDIKGETYFLHLALHSLAWVYIDYKNPLKAIKLCEDILAQYPQNRFFLWALARAYEDVDLTKSIIHYKKLLASIQNSKMNGYNEIVVLHILAQKEFLLKNNQNALSYIQELYSVRYESSIKEKLADRFSDIRNLRGEILAKLHD